jgi:hypothetical protein
MTRKQLRRSAFAALVAGLLCAPAEAAPGLFRAYLSSTGNDLNACALASPCRLLPAALAAVADGGEIWMLDSANYNTAQVEVTKSVTILAIPGALGRVLATGGGSALNINTASVKVALRNLVIVQFGSGTYGVTFVQGGELTMTGCEVANVGTGVYAVAPNSKVSIKDSVLRDSNTGVYVGGTTIATIDRTRIENNLTYGINIGNLARLTASNSFVTGNSTGMYLYAGGGSIRSRRSRRPSCRATAPGSCRSAGWRRCRAGHPHTERGQQQQHWDQAFAGLRRSCPDHRRRQHHQPQPPGNPVPEQRRRANRVQPRQQLGEVQCPRLHRHGLGVHRPRGAIGGGNRNDRRAAEGGPYFS